LSFSPPYSERRLPADHAHPAAMTVLHIPSPGVLINGLVYSPAGAGLHPTLVICHGLPGNEKNLDLAQAVRRASWNAVTFNYRGSWGSPGVFRFVQNADDAAAVLAYPLLALTSDDGLAQHTDAFVDTIKAAGGKNVTTYHVATDHSWSDHRIALESTIITWLAGLSQSPANAARSK
jgi:hypothetical protein